MKKEKVWLLYLSRPGDEPLILSTHKTYMGAISRIEEYKGMYPKSSYFTVEKELEE